jgi:cystathionine beta-lyase family protein involved in aluminum resistance
MFQMDLEKLEQMMKDYEKDELNKEKLVSTQKETDIQSLEKEVKPVKTFQDKKVEKNLFKRFFSFFE